MINTNLIPYHWDDPWKFERYLDKHMGCFLTQGKDMWSGYNLHFHVYFKVTCTSSYISVQVVT